MLCVRQSFQFNLQLILLKTNFDNSSNLLKLHLIPTVDIVIGVPYILMLPFRNNRFIPLDLFKYLFTSFTLIITKFVFCTIETLTLTISFHSIKPILTPLELSNIPFRQLLTLVCCQIILLK